MQKQLRELFRLQFWCQVVEACSINPGSFSNSQNFKTLTAITAEYDTWHHCWSSAGSKYY